MPYLGKSPQHGNYSKLDDFSGDFDGSDATHAIASNGTAITPVRPEALIISINGVIQEPTTDYTVSGTNITFTTAPTSGDNFFGVAMGEQLQIGTPSDATVTSAKLSGNLVTPGTLDVNGQELILDADADTSITADTDDKIDVKIGGTDAMTLDEATRVGAYTLRLQGAGATGKGGVFDAEYNDSYGIKMGVESHISNNNNTGGIIDAYGANTLTLKTNSNNAMVIAAAGEITKPLQSSFRAYSSGNTTFTSGSYVKIGFTSETYDTNADYTTATSRFTAPVDGRYLFCVNLMGLEGFGTTDGAQIIMDIYVNNAHNSIVKREKLDADDDYAQYYDNLGVSGTTIIKLDASDYVEVFISQNSGSGLIMNYGVGYADWQGELLG